MTRPAQLVGRRAPSATKGIILRPNAAAARHHQATRPLAETIPDGSARHHRRQTTWLYPPWKTWTRNPATPSGDTDCLQQRSRHDPHRRYPHGSSGRLRRILQPVRKRTVRPAEGTRPQRRASTLRRPTLRLWREKASPRPRAVRCACRHDKHDNRHNLCRHTVTGAPATRTRLRANLGPASDFSQRDNTQRGQHD